MTDPTPEEPEPADGLDDPDLTNPLTPEDILNSANTSGSDSQASRLVALAQFTYDLVKGADGRPYATERHGPAIAFTLRGRDGLRTRMARTYYATYRQAPGGSALTDALTVLEGQADLADPAPVALRVAAAGERRIVVDLGTVDGRCVIIEPGGWHVANRSPVLFRRSALTSPLPDPVVGGRLDGLRNLINVDEARFRLVVAWLVAALMPDIPHPILALIGEQGTAKSTAARLIVSLVDPSPAPLRTPPGEMRSWAAAASASWIVALDNVSTIPPWFSDTLCKAVTGDGIVERSLHTDDDINVLTFRRCIALTSIDAGRLAGDLAERLLPVELARIDAGRRRADAEITAAYNQAAPTVLGALFTLTAQVLEQLPNVQLDELPRMADFARILAALDHICGWTTLTDYTTAAADASQAVLEADPVAEAIRVFAARTDRWQGTATELLAAIAPNRQPRGWPQSARGLTNTLTRLAPALRADGIKIEFLRAGSDRRRVVSVQAEAPPSKVEMSLPVLPDPPATPEPTP